MTTFTYRLFLGGFAGVFVAYRLVHDLKHFWAYRSAIRRNTPMAIQERTWGEKYHPAMNETNYNLLAGGMYAFWAYIALWTVSNAGPWMVGTVASIAYAVYFGLSFMSANFLGCWAVRRLLDSQTLQEQSRQDDFDTSRQLNVRFWRWMAVSYLVFVTLWALAAYGDWKVPSPI